MRVVPEDPSAVEAALRAGRLRCPTCRGRLRPWGNARPRVIRFGLAQRRSVRPRRARCLTCGATHVLLPGWMLARRADAAPVIWSALAAHVRGMGYRRIALRLRLPETTVRGWLRAYRGGNLPGPSGVVLAPSGAVLPAPGERQPDHANTSSPQLRRSSRLSGVAASR